MKKMTAIYLRTSTNKQEKGLQAQKLALLDYCEKNDIINYKIFEDEGISGTKGRDKRPALDEMMTLVETGEIDTVLVYSFSRMARSTKHLLDVMETFQKLGVHFVSKTEALDTSSPMGKAMYVIISALSTLERDLTRERILTGLENCRAKGIRLGRPQKRNTKLIRELLSMNKYTQKEISILAKTSRASVWREKMAMKKDSPKSIWRDHP